MKINKEYILYMDEYIIRKITKKQGKKYYHKYYDKKNNEINDDKYIKKVTDGIYISPAYENVKINLKTNAKVRAIGYDTEKRPQYIYNKSFIESQKNKKFEHMSAFGKKFMKINQKINEDLYSPKDSKEKQIAIILKLIMECHFRIGNEKYSKKYKSYGTTTLENHHLKTKKDKVIIDFIGKKKVRNVCTVKNKKVVKSLKEKKRTLKKNDRIFSYRKGNEYYNIKSSDVNNYLKKFGNFTAKNFRTWGANIEFIVQVNKYCRNQKIEKKKDIESCIKKSIKEVACALHNTSAVCKANYLDPELINFLKNDSDGFLKHFDISSKEELYKKYVSFLDSI
jgi:DNA topoisomerase I